MAYFSVKQRSATETVIEKSRFLGFAAHTENEQEARAFLGELREKHPLATHVCFGYVADRTGNVQRFSDDGEPQGTAGMPILNAVKGKKLLETTVAVVRYFGGIKLGAGGLTRAYSNAALDAIAAAGVAEYDECCETEISVSYPELDALLRCLSERGQKIVSRAFGENAVVTVAVRKNAMQEFSETVSDRLHGRANFKTIRTYFAPV